MLPKATWPPSAIEELDRTLNDTPADHTWKRWEYSDLHPITDDDLDDLVTRVEREQFAHAY